MISPQTIETILRIAGDVGEQIAIAILRAIHAGDVDTVTQLSAVLPDADAQALADEALIQQQRRLAGVTA